MLLRILKVHRSKYLTRVTHYSTKRTRAINPASYVQQHHLLPTICQSILLDAIGGF